MSQFPQDYIVYLTDGAQSGDWHPEVFPAIWQRLATLEKQVFGIAQQPPYPVTEAPPPQ